MTMGERIRMLRKQHKMSMEELGSKIGVGKSAILKYEKGLVENLPRSTIEKMSIIFGVSPEYIMAFDEKEKSEYLTEDMVKKYLVDKYGDRVIELVDRCLKLTEKNQCKLLELSEDLIKAQNYDSVASIVFK